MPARSTCHAEIDRLHAFFVSWFTATAEAEGFDSVGRALDPDFEMVTPDGTRRARDAVLESIREAHGRHEPGTFDIDIRSVSLIQEMDRFATVRYEEWQDTPTETTGRISTVLFREAPEAPGDLVWVDLHETWIE